jgi:hypothetical protein
MNRDDRIPVGSRSVAHGGDTGTVVPVRTSSYVPARGTAASLAGPTADSPEVLSNPQPAASPLSAAPAHPPFQFPAQQCCGGGNNLAPADANITVSHNYVLEAVNSSITAYYRSTNGGLYWHTSLPGWLGLKSGSYCVDPRVIYWSWDNRFALVCSVTGTSPPLTDVAVSESSNPAAPWCIYRYNPPAFIDQPSITATADKIGISGTRVDNSDGYAVVWQKSSMLTCSPARYVGTENNHALWRAAVHLTNEFDAKFVTVGGGLWLLNASGTPNQGNVTWTQTKVENKDYAVLSDPADPGGHVGGGDLDNRFLSAQQEYAGGHYVMELESTENCNQGLCIESVRIDFTSCGCVTHTFYLGEGNGVVYIYGSGTLDASGNIFISYSRVGTSFTPQAVAAAFNPSGSLRWNNIIYGSTSGTTSCSGSNCDERWGDYLGAYQDPSTPSQVWFGGEYQLSSGQYGWGTVIAAGTINGIE